MREPTSVEFINEVYDSICSNSSSAQAIHLLKRYFQFFGSLEITPTLYRHKLYNSSFLIHAVQQQNVTVVRFLLSMSVDVAFKHHSHQYTALWALCQALHTENTITIAKLLLPHTNIESYSHDFSTSLLYAILTTTHEYTQHTSTFLQLIFKEYNKYATKPSQFFSQLDHNNGSIIDGHVDGDKIDTQQYYLPTRLLSGEVPFPYTLLPPAVQQYNNAQHESLKIPAAQQQNFIQLSLFQLVFYNPSQLHLSIWVKNVLQVLLPYYCYSIIEQSYESLYFNLFYFEQWILNSLLSSHLASVESIMYVFNLDFYNYPTNSTQLSKNAPQLVNNSTRHVKQTLTQIQSSTTVSMQSQIKHPLLVNGKMPYFDYIYTYLEHVLHLHSQQKQSPASLNKGNLDSVLIIQLLLSLPSVNLHGWSWDEDIVNEDNNNNNNNNNNSKLLQNDQPSQKSYPKLTRYEFSQLTWLLFYLHPRPSTIGLVENVFKLLFDHTYVPTPNTPVLISPQYSTRLQLNEHLYDPESLYSYGSILSAFLHANYQLPKSLLGFIVQNITKFEKDIPSQQTPFSLDLFPSQTREINIVKSYNQFYPFRLYLLDYLSHGVRTFSKYDGNTVEFIKFLYNWLMYPVLPSTTPSMNIAVPIPSASSNSTGGKTEGKDTNTVNKKEYHYGELFFVFIFGTILQNTTISQYDAAQLVEYLFQLYTKDFPKISSQMFALTFQLHLRSRSMNFFLLTHIFNIITKYQFNAANCPDFNKARAINMYYNIFETASWGSQSFNLTHFLDTVFEFKKSKDLHFTPSHNNPNSSDVQFHTLSAKSGLTIAEPKTSSKSPQKCHKAPQTSYERIRDMIHNHVKEFCRLTVHVHNKDVGAAFASGTNSPEEGEIADNKQQEYQFKHPYWSLRPDLFQLVFSRVSPVRSFLLGGDANSTFNNPFVTEYSNELFLRLFLTELLRYYKGKALTARIMTLIVLLMATIIKPPVLSVKYQPNRPYRDYLYSYNASLYFSPQSTSPLPSLPSSSSSLSNQSIGSQEGYTRRRGNVVYGHLPTPDRPPQPSAPNPLPGGINGAGFGLGGLGNQKSSVLPTQRLKSIVSTMNNNGIIAPEDKKQCWYHYYLFAQFFTTLRKPNATTTTTTTTTSVLIGTSTTTTTTIISDQKGSHPIQDKPSLGVNTDIVVTDDQPPSSLAPSPTNSSASNLPFNIRFVNQQHKKQPSGVYSNNTSPHLSQHHTRVGSTDQDNLSPSPSMDSINEQNRAEDGSPKEAPKPARKMLKPSNQQQSKEGRGVVDANIENNHGKAQVTGDDENKPLVLNKFNNRFTITATTPTLVPHEHRFNSNHFYAHNFGLYRRTIFSTNLIDNVVLTNDLGDNDKSRKSILKSNTKRFEFTLFDPYEKQQLFGIDLLFSFINSLFSSHISNTTPIYDISASSALNKSQSPISPLMSPGLIASPSRSTLSGLMTPKVAPQLSEDMPDFLLNATPISKQSSGANKSLTSSSSSLVSNSSIDFDSLQNFDAIFSGLDPASFDPSQHFSLIHNPINPLPPAQNKGYVYFDVTHLFLHETSAHSLSMLTKLIDNALKCPQYTSIITSPPDPVYRFQAASHFIPTNLSPSYAPPTHSGSLYESNVVDMSPQTPYLNYLHWCIYNHDDNYMHTWRPHYYHPDIYSAGQASGANSPLVGGDSTPVLVPSPLPKQSSGDLGNSCAPMSLNGSNSSIGASSPSLSLGYQFTSPFAQFSKLERTHLPPFLSLLWCGAPQLYNNSADFNITQHTFPPQNPQDAIYKAHHSINQSLNPTHPNVFITHNRPSYRLHINTFFVQSFKLLLSYWVALTYQRYHWLKGNLSYVYDQDNYTPLINYRTNTISLADTFTVQQQLLQALYTPYLNPNHSSFINPAISSYSLPSIFSQIPTLFLFFSRFTPHILSPYLIDMINNIISHLSIPKLSGLGQQNLQSDQVIQEQFSHFGSNSLQPFDVPLTTTPSMLDSSIGSYSNYNNNNNNYDGGLSGTYSLSSQQSEERPAGKGIFASIASSFFKKSDKNSTPLTLQSSDTLNTSSDDHITDHLLNPDLVLTPLHVISTNHANEHHTKPLSSFHNNFCPIDVSPQTSTQQAYLALLESVLFTEQRHHYQFFLAKQSSPWHQNSLLPLSIKSSTSASVLSFNVFRFVNMFHFDFFTPLHMLLLPNHHPIKNQLITQTQHQLDLPFATVSSADPLLCSAQTSKTLFIPANNNFLFSNLYYHKTVSPPTAENPPNIDPLPASISPILPTGPSDTLVTYIDNRNTLASLQRINSTMSLPLSTLLPNNNHSPSVYTFTPYLFTLLSIYSAYGFDWNTSILSALPNHFTSANITPFLDSTKGESGLGRAGGMGAITMNMMKTFDQQKKSLLAIYTTLVSTYIPPLFILQAYFTTNALYVSFFATLFGFQRYLSHSILNTSGYGLLKNGKSSLTHLFTTSPQTSTETDDGKQSAQNEYKTVNKGSNIAHKPFVFPPTLLTPNDVQHQTLAPYQFASEFYSNNSTDEPIPLLQTLFTQNYGVPSNPNLNLKNDKKGQKLQSSAASNQPEWLSSPSTYATNYPIPTHVNVNQYISSAALSQLSLISTSTQGKALPQFKSYTLLTLSLLRQDLSWDTNWLHLLVLLVQNGAYIDYNNLYLTARNQLPDRGVPLSSSSGLFSKALKQQPSGDEFSSPDGKLSVYTNDILIHLLSGHNNRHTRHVSWFKAIALLLSSGCNVLWFNNQKQPLRKDQNYLSTQTWSKTQQPPKLPPSITQLKQIYFSPIDQTNNSNLPGATTLGQWLPSYQQIWTMVMFYHQQGFMSTNNKYCNITTALLFHPRVEMRKYFFEPFRIYYNLIYQPWVQQVMENSNRSSGGGGGGGGGKFFNKKKEQNKDREIPPIQERFVPQIINRLFSTHHVLISFDLIYAFTPRSTHNLADQTIILSYFSTLPFTIFIFLHRYILSLLHLYHKEYSLIPLNNNRSFEEVLTSVYNCISRNLVDLNKLPNIIPNPRSTQLYNVDSTKPLDISSQSDNYDKLYVKVHVNDIPTRPYLEYTSIFGSVVHGLLDQAETSAQIKATPGLSGTLNSLFEAPTHDELNSGTSRLYLPDGTHGLLFYILNNCYPHSKYLPTSYVLQDWFFNPKLYSSQLHLGISSDDTSTPVNTDGSVNHSLDDDATFITSTNQLSYSKPADISQLPHDMTEFLQYIIHEYRTSGNSASISPFTTTTQLNQSLLQHAILRRFPEELLFTMTNTITSYTPPGSTASTPSALVKMGNKSPTGLDHLFTHFDFNGYNFLDYLYYCQIESYAPNFVTYIAEYYTNQYRGKVVQLVDYHFGTISPELKQQAMQQIQSQHGNSYDNVNAAIQDNHGVPISHKKQLSLHDQFQQTTQTSNIPTKTQPRPQSSVSPGPLVANQQRSHVPSSALKPILPLSSAGTKSADSLVQHMENIFNFDDHGDDDDGDGDGDFSLGQPKNTFPPQHSSHIQNSQYGKAFVPKESHKFEPFDEMDFPPPPPPPSDDEY